MRGSRRARKQRRNWRQLFDDLVAPGYRGSYDRLAAFARAWERQREEQAVLCAVELALEAGAVSKEHVLHLLGRLTEAEVPAPIDNPTRLTLIEEPAANVTRYDHLRGTHRG